jgi:hypothetical protein
MAVRNMSNGGLTILLPWILACSLDSVAGQRDPFQPGVRLADAVRPEVRGAIKGWVVDGERRKLLTIDGQGHWILRGDIPDDTPRAVQGGWPMGAVIEHKDDEL